MRQLGNTELQTVYDYVMKAVYAEDIFGKFTDNKEEMSRTIEITYRKLAKVIHPDRNIGNSEMATEAFKKLSKFREGAQESIKRNIYGQQKEDKAENTNFIIKTQKYEYKILSTLAEGDLSTVYEGSCENSNIFNGKVAIKVFENIEDNIFAQNEIRVLELFQLDQGKQCKHLPVFIDKFRTTNKQFGVVLQQINGYDLYSVKEKYKDGIDRKHMVWVLNRLLSVLGYAHSKGVIHANIEPAHFMIRPRDHNGWLIDWCYAAVNPLHSEDKFKIYNEDFSAPEVKEQKSPIPASDLYSVGKLMIYILGGNIKNNTMPGTVEDKLQRFIKFFVRESPIQRAQDAWEMHMELNELVIELWGAKQFLEFKM